MRPDAERRFDNAVVTLCMTQLKNVRGQSTRRPEIHLVRAQPLSAVFGTPLGQFEGTSNRIDRWCGVCMHLSSAVGYTRLVLWK